MTKNTRFAEAHELISHQFPYVLWPIQSAVYSFQPLPESADRIALARWIGDLSRSLKRRAALVLSPSLCIYFDADGAATISDQPPTGGIAFQAAVAVPALPAIY